MLIREACPACGSRRYKKIGHTRHGKQNHQCKACERQFGATADDRLIADDRRTMVNTCCVSASRCAGSAVLWVSVSRGSCISWWNALRPVPRISMSNSSPANIRGAVQIGSGSRRDVELRAEESQQAMGVDCDGRQNASDHCLPRGDRSGGERQALWANIPIVYREQATFHTDR